MGPQFRLGPDFDVCVPPHCANGLRDADEVGIDCGGADCGLCHCGDGIVFPLIGEECDEGTESAPETATCNADCTLAECGDGVLNQTAGEVCEPSLASNCSVDCQTLSSCTSGTLCLSVEHKAGSSPTDNHLNPQLRIVNNSGQPFSLSGLKLRYWFTRHDGAESQWPVCESVQASMSTFCDFADIGCSNVTRTLAEVDPWLSNVDSYLDLALNSTQSLAPGQSTNVHVRIERTDHANLTESNDYSYAANAAHALNSKVALYRDGQLLWGTEPSTALVCGNGQVEACEACDTSVESATCNFDCTPADCGDGYRNVPAGEQCDPGMQTATCDSDCTIPSCGDNHVNPSAGEVCDWSLIPQCRLDCTGFMTGCTNGGLCLKVQRRATDSTSDNQVRPQFRLVNNGFVSVPLSELRVRYYFTIDGSATLQANCDFASFASNNSTNNCGQVQQTFTTISPVRPNADRYLEVRFINTTAVLAPGQSTGDIQLRFNKTTFANFNETNDYSRTGATSSYADTIRLTVLRNSSIIWGTPP